MKNFEGDWDLYVIRADGKELASSYENQLAGASALETVVLKVKEGADLAMYGCNYVGGPSALVTWELKAAD